MIAGVTFSVRQLSDYQLLRGNYLGQSNSTAVTMGQNCMSQRTNEMNPLRSEETKFRFADHLAFSKYILSNPVSTNIIKRLSIPVFLARGF